MRMSRPGSRPVGSLGSLAYAESAVSGAHGRSVTPRSRGLSPSRSRSRLQGSVPAGPLRPLSPGLRTRSVSPSRHHSRSPPPLPLSRNITSRPDSPIRGAGSIPAADSDAFCPTDLPGQPRMSRKSSPRHTSCPVQGPRSAAATQRSRICSLSTPSVDAQAQRAAAAPPRADRLLRFLGHRAGSEQGKREANEDAHAIHATGSGLHAFGLFDGHGGDQVSKALAHGTTGLLPYLAGQVDLETAALRRMHPAATGPEYSRLLLERLPDLLERAFLKYDAELTDEGRRHQKVGSTAVVGLLDPEARGLWLLGLGDSRALLFAVDQKGAHRLIAVTEDHKPERETERARAEAAGGQVYGDGSGVMRVGMDGYDTAYSVSRVVGDTALKTNRRTGRPYDARDGIMSALPEIQFVPVPLDPKIKKLRLLLVCDGITDVMDNEALTQWMDSQVDSDNPGQGPVDCLALADHALRLHSSDNVSALCADFALD